MQKVSALTPRFSFSRYISKKFRFATALTLYFRKGPSANSFVDVSQILIGGTNDWI
jgi:hypothetical protein